MGLMRKAHAVLARDGYASKSPGRRDHAACFGQIMTMSFFKAGVHYLDCRAWVDVVTRLKIS